LLYTVKSNPLGTEEFVQFIQVFGLVQSGLDRLSVYSGFGLNRFHCSYI